MDNWYEYVSDVAKSWGVAFSMPPTAQPISAALDVPDPVQMALPAPPVAAQQPAYTGGGGGGSTPAAPARPTSHTIVTGATGAGQTVPIRWTY